MSVGRTARAPGLDLGALLTGDLAVLQGKVAGPDDPRPAVQSADLMTPTMLDRVVTPFAARWPTDARVAAVSFWTLKYFGTVIPPTVALVVLAGQHLPMRLAETEILLSADGEPEAIRYAGATAPGTPDDLLSEGLMAGHLGPLVAALAGWSRVSPRLLWGNAAHYYEWAVRVAAARPEADRAALAAARRWIDPQAPEAADASPFAGHIRYLDDAGTPVRRRKVCCLRYRLAGVDTCGSLCPLPKVRQAGR
ncbi:siderophore-iron reductase FhuF [Rhodovibrio salinarum]|uniref:Siderophore-iron reductase FhuF n=1 Tax=Rhodovibrio salinarum TaxID=1087 RepID=A0A934V204_9PROT|nr:siderophore-iron reductase FhuF [Rhodovibrio salinarum]MBK1699103.1 siderophore-iron reductase FhuF [Rhodovibrio salinarum]